MTDEIRKAVRERLREKGMSQSELANRSGVREDYVSKVLRGERVKVPGEFGAVLEALGLELTVREKR